MAEFCLECWNKLNKRNDSERKYIISDYLDLCEGCGEWKPVIIMERTSYYLYKFRYILLPFKIILFMVLILWRIITLPYLLFYYYWQKKKRNNK